MYSDHEFEGRQGEPCQAELMKRGGYHTFEGDAIRTRAWGGQDIVASKTCLAHLPEGYVCSQAKDDDIHKATRTCGASWTSVLHPPDQFRHWCSALEAGGDCMHFEEDE